MEEQHEDVSDAMNRGREVCALIATGEPKKELGFTKSSRHSADIVRYQKCLVFFPAVFAQKCPV